MHVNGKLTLGENIADLGGLLVTIDAYHASLGGKPAPVIDGLTGDQRFFLAYAQSHRGKLRDAALRARVATDVHAPAPWRVLTDGHTPDQWRALTVRNIDGWYNAFNVQQGEKLYLAPDKRIRIWE